MFEKTILKIAESLDERGIPYMIIGGQAVLLYGEPRLTRDIDVTLGVNTDRAGEIFAIAGKIAFKPIPEDAETFVKETMVLPVRDEATGIRVDFIFSFTPYESQAIKRARRIKILNGLVCFASPEDLIIHKIFAGRPRDVEDVKNVILKQRGLDKDYIRNWLKKFDASFEKSGFLKIFDGILGEIEKS